MTYCMRYICLFLISYLYLNAADYQDGKDAMSLLIPDIARQRIQPLLSYQDIGRLKQCVGWCNELYDVKDMCSHCSWGDHRTYACAKLATNYYACSKALGYCARTNDKKMFTCLWQHHTATRDLFHSDQESIMVECNQLYRSVDNTKQTIIKHIQWLLRQKGVIAEALFSGSCLNSIGSQFFPVLKKIMIQACQNKWPFVVGDLYMGDISAKT